MRIDWLDPRMQKRAADLSAGGHSARAIAEIFGVSVDSAKSAMHRYGLYAFSRGPKRAPIAQAHGERLKSLRNGGWTYARIGREFGVTRYAVYRALARMRKGAA